MAQESIFYNLNISLLQCPRKSVFARQFHSENKQIKIVLIFHSILRALPRGKYMQTVKNFVLFRVRRIEALITKSIKNVRIVRDIVHVHRRIN